MNGNAARIGRGKGRRAVTLVEILGSISVLLVLGVSAASMLGQMTEIASSMARGGEARRVIARLSQQLRADARRAETIELGPDGRSLKLVSGARTFHYRWPAGEQAIYREANSQSEPDRFDRFLLPADSQPRVSADQRLVTLDLSRDRAAYRWLIEVTRR